MKPFLVYLLRCADGSYYAGHTDDIERRLAQHFEGAIDHTATRKPVELVWQGEFETREGALAFELRIKGWSRAKKEALIRGDWEAVSALARNSRAVAHEGLRQAQPERAGERPERGGERPVRGGERPERAGTSVRPEPVEGPSHAPVRAESLATSTRRSVRPEPVEGPSHDPARPGPLATPTPKSVRPEPVEGPGRSVHPSLLTDLRGADPARQRRAIAKSITLLESTRADHRAQADELLTALLPHTGQAFRLGISGVPGVGKSTFIEALGLYLIEHGHRVAVLAVDPSSSVSGGSILGDKTRMERLSVHPQAYIRPSPASGTLGGVAEKTREAMLVCEAAGYDVVIVETVGVGQSEIAVSGMTDMFVLLQLPNAGDDLQAIKKGVMELADLVAINKADLDPDAATRAQAQITSALRLLGMHGHPEHATGDAALWQPRVVQLSALQGRGVAEFWTDVARFRELQAANGRLAKRREQQARAWMWERVDAGLKQRFRDHPRVRAVLAGIAHEVAAGRLAASTAARQLLDMYSPTTVGAELVEAHAIHQRSPSTGSGRTE